MLAAGVQAVSQQVRRPRAMSDVLGGVKLRDIVDAASRYYEHKHGRVADPPLTPSSIYRDWEDKDDYLRDVFRAMFTNPEGLATKALEDADSDWESGLRAWVASDMKQIADTGPGYFLAFPATEDGMVRDVLANVYADFDDFVVPRLRDFLRTHNMRITLPPTDVDPDGCRRLAGMLTALTEGWYLRTLAQPELQADEPWLDQAVATVRGLTATSD
ncbi:hypothetical protein [Nocardioides daphniae]|uniref:Uncharacterized protein n=1 Tax=Nocardioides daphniae TaxID=402297 RepID=A0A4P7UBP2_9ACTN|nr:hypothetical protein [Nocardioides daphniae]QCC77406.1 hypothetical protein E2C04_09820 [Nocardioides daphniae]